MTILAASFAATTNKWRFHGERQSRNFHENYRSSLRVISPPARLVTILIFIQIPIAMKQDY